MPDLKLPHAFHPAKSANPLSSAAGDGHVAASDRAKDSRIFTTPYPLADVAGEFQAKYAEYIGYTIQAEQCDQLYDRFGQSNASDIRKAIECLGFRKLDEDMAECMVADDEKLSLMIMTSRDNYPALSGSNYLKMSLTAAPLQDTLGSDSKLAHCLSQVEDQMAQKNMSFLTDSGEVFGLASFLPFSLDMKDWSRQAEVLASTPGAYLLKTARNSATPRQRQLIRIHPDSSAKSVRAYLSGVSSSQLATASLQTYVERPLLVDKRKFSIRAYLIIVRPKRGGGSGARPLDSGYFAFLHPGYAHLQPKPFDPDNPEAAEVGASGAVNQRLMEASTWFPDELNAYLNRRRGCHMPPDWIKTVFYPRAGAIFGYLAALLRYQLHDRDSTTGSFLILSVSLLVDESLRLHLLKVDDQAALWSRPTSVIDFVLPSLWIEAVCLASEIAVRFRTCRTICNDRLLVRRNFRMVYSSEDPCLARKNVTLVYD